VFVLDLNPTREHCESMALRNGITNAFPTPPGQQRLSTGLTGTRGIPLSLDPPT